MKSTEALTVLRQLAGLETLKLNLKEHSVVQEALQVLDGVVNPHVADATPKIVPDENPA